MIYTDDKGKKYSVRFDLQVKMVNLPENDAGIHDPIGNTYQVKTKLDGNKKSAIGKTRGYKIQVLASKAFGLTGAHEVGHTLMNLSTEDKEHSTYGIMVQNKSDANFCGIISQETIDTIIKSNLNNLTLWQKIILWLNIE